MKKNNKKTTNVSAISKNERKKQKLIASILLATAAVIILVCLVYALAGESHEVNIASNEWKNNYSTKVSYIVPVLVEDNTLCVITEAGWEKVSVIPTSQPNWVIEGTKDAREGNFNEQALFAARLLEVESKLSTEEVQEIWALGIGYFENSKDDYSEEGWEKIEVSLIGRLEKN